MMKYLRSDNNKRLWYGLGCVIVSLATCIIALLIGIIFFNWAFQEPDNARVHLQIPASVKQGETFGLVVLVESLEIRPLLLNGIEISPDYLAGIRIEESAPPFIETTERPYSHDQAFSYNLTLEPGEIVAIEFSAVGQEAGTFSGELDVCVDGMVRCLSYAIQTRVEE